MLVGMKEMLHIAAPGKVNLALWVGPVGADGMHPICSWMVTIDLCDDLALHRLPPGRLSRYAILWHQEALQRTEIDWSIKKDLAVRAHLALQSHVGRDLPIQMKLEKRIPVGGGMGGGSSNAAATLRGLNSLFDLGLSTADLAGIGSGIGSDVPFFIDGGSALVEGAGEKVTVQPTSSPIHLALFFPGVACHTGKVYEQFDQMTASANSPQQVYDMLESSLDPDVLFNDLGAAACCVAPVLNTHIEQIQALAERSVCVSGSGSTLFVVCDDMMHAEALVQAVHKDSGLLGIATSSIQEAPPLLVEGP